MKKLCVLFLFMLLVLSASSVNAQVKDGDLIKGSADNIYLIADGKACWIPTQEVFVDMKLDWKAVQAIDDAKLTAMPKGLLIFKGESKNYSVNLNGKAALIGDSITFSKMGMNPKLVCNVSDKVIAGLPQTAFVIKGKSAAKYLVAGGKLCQFSSDKIFKALGFDPANITTVNDKGIAGLKKSPLLVKGEGDKIYVIEKDKRCLVSSPEVFKKKKYDEKTVLSIEDKILNAIAEGKPIK